MLIVVFTVDEVEFVEVVVLLLVETVPVALVEDVVDVVVDEDCTANTLKVTAPYTTANTSSDAMAIEPTTETIALREVTWILLCLIRACFAKTDFLPCGYLIAQRVLVLLYPQNLPNKSFLG